MKKDTAVAQVFARTTAIRRIAARYGKQIPELDRNEIMVEVRGANNSELKDIQELLTAGNSRLDASVLDSSIILRGDTGELNKQLTAMKSQYSGLMLQAVSNYLKQSTTDKWFGLKGSPLIMGIVNVTPDSFSDGGHYFTEEKAVEHASALLEDGADIIDIGGESTRPGSDPVPLKEEKRRTIPVIREIKKRYPDAIVSIDTTKSEVAGAALSAGAAIVNDISGGTFDPEIFNVSANYGAAVVLMHTKDRPKVMQKDTNYSDLVREIYDFLYIQMQRAKSVGIERIAVDPGIGFGKTPGQNWELIDRIADFRSLGFPVLIGLSRKSFLGRLLDLEADERDTATVIAETASVINGAGIIRTHNVRNAVLMKRITTALRENRQ